MDAVSPTKLPDTVDATLAMLGSADYIADRSLATAVHLALHLKRPLFLEGEAGVGKTEIAKVLATALQRRLIRLQCYEGLDVASAVYEWDYARQMIEIRLAEAAEEDRGEIESTIFSDRFLIKRPLLQALEPDIGGCAGPADRRTRPHRRAVRSLSARAAVRFSGDDPGDRHDPCRASADRHHHLEPHARDPRRAEAALLLLLGRLPDRGARAGNPEAQGARRRASICRSEVVGFVQKLRTMDLFKLPGIAETIDWTEALMQLDVLELGPQAINDTLGVLLKYQDDIARIQGSEAARLLDQIKAEAAAAAA